MPSKISAFAPLAIGILLPRWGGAQARQDTIPFVGCPADGQAGPIEAPKGPPKVVAGTDVPASRLAYYKGEEAGSVRPSRLALQSVVRLIGKYADHHTDAH